MLALSGCARSKGGKQCHSTVAKKSGRKNTVLWLELCRFRIDWVERLEEVAELALRIECEDAIAARFQVVEHRRLSFREESLRELGSGQRALFIAEPVGDDHLLRTVRQVRHRSCGVYRSGGDGDFQLSKLLGDDVEVLDDCRRVVAFEAVQLGRTESQDVTGRANE